MFRLTYVIFDVVENVRPVSVREIGPADVGPSLTFVKFLSQMEHLRNTIPSHYLRGSLF